MGQIIPRYETVQSFSDPKIKKEAREMFFEGCLPTDIAESLNINFEELHLAVFGKNKKGTEPKCWHVLRQERNKQLTGRSDIQGNSVQGWTKTKYYYLNKTESRLMQLVQRSIDAFDAEDFLLTDMKELRAALDALGIIDKVKRLEDGKPTEHIQIDHGLSLGEITREYERRKGHASTT